MAPMAEQIANMVDMLPEAEQALALELVKRLVLAWDPDFTKLTPAEKAQLDRATIEMDAGDYVADHDALWN